MRDGAIVEGGVAAQTTQTMANLADRLAEAGAALDDVVKTLCFLTDMGTFAEFNDAYAAAFGDHRPARSTVEVVGAARRAWTSRSRPGRTSRVTDEPPRCGWAGERPAATSTTTTPSGACPSATRGGCSSSSSSRAPRPGCRGRRSCTSATATPRCFAGFDPERRRRLRRRRRRPLPRRPGHRAQPGQGRRGRSATPGRGSSSTTRSAFLWAFVDGAPVQNHWTTLGEVPATHAGLRGDEQGPEEARLPLRRPDDLLRADAVVRPRQRPRHELLPPRRVRRS